MDQALLRRATSRSHAVVMVQVFAVTVMVFPSDLIIKTVGADGYPAILIAYFMLLAWVAATLFGLHNPLHYRYPVRMALWVLWLVSLISYALIDPAVVTPLERASADRWLMQLAGVSGVILVTAECLRSREDIRRVLRALTWGGAFCGMVAALQFFLRLDVTPYLRWVLPGFSVNVIASGNADIILRGSTNRVFGTAVDPIELGVSAAMLLPLAVWLAMYDTKRSAYGRWFPVILHRDRRHSLCVPFSRPGRHRLHGCVHRRDAPGASRDSLGRLASGGGGHLRNLPRNDWHPEIIVLRRNQ